MSSDEVNSISDTTESLQVANIVQNKYYDIISRGALPDDYNLFQLNASIDPTKPTLMSVPAGCTFIKWIKYYDSNPADGQQVSQFGSYSHAVNSSLLSSTNTGWVTTSTTSLAIGTGTKVFTVGTGLSISLGDNVTATSGINSMSGFVTGYSGTTLTCNMTSSIGAGTFNAWVIQNSASNAPPGYKFVRMYSVEDFLRFIDSFSLNDNNVGSYLFNELGETFTFKYRNNLQPSCCTVLSNQYVVFDSFQENFDTTLQTSKTQCYGSIFPAFSLVDSFIPIMDDNQFPLLFNESLSVAFYELKQQPNAKAEQEVKRQWSTVQKNKRIPYRPTPFDQIPSFGRQPRTGGYGGYLYGPRFWS